MQALRGGPDGSRATCAVGACGLRTCAGSATRLRAGATSTCQGRLGGAGAALPTPAIAIALSAMRPTLGGARGRGPGTSGVAPVIRVAATRLGRGLRSRSALALRVTGVPAAPGAPSSVAACAVTAVRGFAPGGPRAAPTSATGSGDGSVGAVVVAATGESATCVSGDLVTTRNSQGINFLIRC